MILKYLIILCLLALVACKSYYTVIAPGTIKSNRNYTVTVSLHEANEPSTIQISIEGPSLNEAKNVYLRPFETKQIDFMPQKLLDGDYKFKAEGITGVMFQKEAKLLVMDSNGPKIYIQSDKAVYKPKDLVQFRVVILDEHTRPLKIKEPIRIEILDGLDNRVKNFKDIMLVKGVYTGHFQLSEYPVLGSWKIKVILTGKYSYSKFKKITVKKYTLPRFNVYIKAPSIILRKDDVLKAGIYARYTYDKYVQGYANIELYNEDNGNLLQRNQFEVENYDSIEYHLKDFKDFQYLKTLKIVAKFTENLTGIEHESRHFIRVKDQKYQIKVLDDEIEFRNSTPYRLKAHVDYWTGATVLDRKTPVIMEHGSKRYEAYLNENGVAMFEFEHQPLADYKFKFYDAQEKLPNIWMPTSTQLIEGDYYCRLKILGGSLRLGNPVEIEVSSIVNIPYLMYTLVGHGNIIRTERIDVPANKKSFIIRLMPSIEMIPVSYLYVYYILDGNFKFEEIALRFPLEFENQISVEAPKEVKPGEEVTITLKAQPKSYVSILAVDLSVYILDNSYDLKRSEILEDLLNDRSYTKTNGAGALSGVITFTNANNPLLFIELETGFQPAITMPLQFRNRFPETWIFQNLEINDNETHLKLQIPDTITTWRITAFSNNDITGFGIVKQPTDIITIKPFFITLNLPYSVKLGEIVTITVIVFNYHEEALDTEVIMYNEKKDFYFIESNVQEDEKSNEDQKKVKHVNVPSENGKTVIFFITPMRLGEIDLKISATNSQFKDGIEQKLRVEAEGVLKQHNKVKYFNIPAGETLSSSFFIEFPSDIATNSEYITLSAGGDYMVPTLENYDDLIQLPTGCGEQNMVNFAPNILMLEYLKINGKLSQEKELVKRIRSYIDIGYQQQLSFRHKNGGYSVFGEHSDAEPSNWLTAYTVRYLIKSTRYSPVETKIIEADLNYLSLQQKSHGEFMHSSYTFSPSHQNKYGFTAFVLLTFLEDRKYAVKYKETIEKGLQFLNSNLDNIRDTYALAIVACALKAAKHTNANRATEKLKELKKTDAHDHVWWSGKYKHTANKVEITGYALMALLDTPGDHTGILKWLLMQRNQKGGFKSSQDTVVGLEALVKYTLKYKNHNDVDLKIKYRARDRDGVDLHYDQFILDADNALVFQQHKLPILTRTISFEANGTGHSLIQASYQYYIIEDHHSGFFNIKPILKMLNDNELDLKICFSYQDQSSPTNMVIMEVNLPSGFRSDLESDFDIDNHDTIQRIESKNFESTIILYFDNLLPNEQYCLNILADKISDVSMTKSSAIIIYDYYNLTRSDVEFYKIQK